MPPQFGTLIGQNAAVMQSRIIHAKRFLSINTAVNIFFASDKFYQVLLVFYILAKSVSSLYTYIACCLFFVLFFG